MISPDLYHKHFAINHSHYKTRMRKRETSDKKGIHVFSATINLDFHTQKINYVYF